jgi:hypothetical protein
MKNKEYFDAMLKRLTLAQPGRWMTEGVTKLCKCNVIYFFNTVAAPEDDIASVAKLLNTLCSSIEKVKDLHLFDIYPCLQIENNLMD